MDKRTKLYHIILETKANGIINSSERRDLLFNEIKVMFSNRRCHVFAIGGHDDHVHIIADVPVRKDFSRMLKKIRSLSWLKANDIFGSMNFSGWSKKIMAIPLDKNLFPNWIKFVESQDEIHLQISWEEEKKLFSKFKTEIISC